MEKSSWLEIRQKQFRPPEGQNLAALTEELLGYLGSTEPELRDTIGYETFATWLGEGLYSPDELRAYSLRLQLNLQEGLGEPESDSLFLRAFSVLCLAEIIESDNQRPFLDADEVRNILSKGLAYLEAEADPRGYVPGKGWGHALAHTADLLFVLARSPHLHADDLARILNGIAERLVTSTHWLYVHGEDDRLARAVMTVFERDLLDAKTLQAWLAALTSPLEQGWKEAWTEEGRTAAFFNTRNFLRSLMIRVINSAALPHHAELQSLLAEANSGMRAD